MKVLVVGARLVAMTKKQIVALRYWRKSDMPVSSGPVVSRASLLDSRRDVLRVWLVSKGLGNLCCG